MFDIVFILHEKLCKSHNIRKHENKNILLHIRTKTFKTKNTTGIDKDKYKMIKYICKHIQRMDFQVDEFFLTNRK